MEKFEALQTIDNFCKVLVKKATESNSQKDNKQENGALAKTAFEKTRWYRPLREASSATGNTAKSEIEEPLVDFFDEEDHIRILVQCRCREQQVTFHPCADGIMVCREECRKERGGPETYNDVCRKLSIPTSELQLGNMEFVIAKCNNNNTLEAMIPKVKNKSGNSAS
jgi:hypothetical protein